MWIMDKIKNLFGLQIPESIDKLRFFELEIMRWKASQARREALDGDRYYEGGHDIMRRKRTVIGQGGELEEVTNLPNNRIIDNQYKKMVNQKANYLLSKPVTFETGNGAMDSELKALFNHQFLNRLKSGGIDAMNGGLFWFYVYYDEQGNLSFQKFKPFEVLPFWKDAEHTQLDCAIRVYPMEVYEGQTLKVIEKVEIYTTEGIDYYQLENNRLIPDGTEPHKEYMYFEGKGLNWERIPLVAFKYNDRELPLIRNVKGLQDALNVMLSDLMNNMQEDSRNTILIIKNYDGQNLADFRKNLATYGAVKVRTVDGGDGGVEALSVEVNAQNYELVLKTIKKAIVENAMGYDARDDRIGSNANMMNLKSMYSDIELDTDNMESEFQASFEQLLWFVKQYFKTTGKGDLGEVTITFNRDIMVNETEVIDNLTKLGVQLPNEILVGQVPFVNDVAKVMEMLKKEREENMEYNDGAFPNQGNENE